MPALGRRPVIMLRVSAFNLVSNAWDAVPQGERVTITTARLAVEQDVRKTFLQKPFSSDLLLRTVRSLLDES